MANRAAVACVDSVCQLIMGSTLPFGGKTVVFLGDFRQTCPVIPHASKQEVLDVSIKSAALWSQFSVHALTTPIRNAEDPEFALCVDAIGDGAGPVMDLSILASVPAARDLVNFVYPSHILDDPASCKYRAILAPTNVQIDAFNADILNRVDGISKQYIAADSLKELEELDCEMTEPQAVLDWVAQRAFPGLPPHTLTIKVNGVYRLLRNFSLDCGLVKNM